MTVDVGTRETLDLDWLRSMADQRLAEFLQVKITTADSDETAALLGLLSDFHKQGGKRIRPLLCLCGWHAAANGHPIDVAIDVAASLELFHMFALIHDDIMDRSDVRRGNPSAHRVLASHWCGDDSSKGDPEWFGTSAAILLGDLALALSLEMLTASGMTDEQYRAVRPVLDAMHTEVILGQYHDLLAEQRLSADIAATLRVIRYKTAKYTVERPLHLGAALAGGGSAVLEACTAYALPLGEAFQLRDDVLGVFGDPEVTGKSTVDDLRDGKRTTLIAVALQQGNSTEGALLRSLVGNPDLDASGAEAIRNVLVSTGALQIVEGMIKDRLAIANRALDNAPFPRPVYNTLADMAHRLTSRTY
ncbi:polyprenyl synthetase family protein [Saccharopolyspora pogona]|uniref:polyprenyl synthetase family protein n=1 Tax=Saccharopolyspora pogona TaxID=333966 RepID=UPI0016883C4F|nr:polyprenyl synthetase family protein [Saccharopolyspora pogona]